MVRNINDSEQFDQFQNYQASVQPMFSAMNNVRMEQ